MTVEIENHADIAVVTLARPKVNALDLRMVEQLENAFERLATEKQSGVVLRGSSGAFCAGFDTKAFTSYGPPEQQRMVLTLNRLAVKLLSLPCPIVAAVNGHALGAGLILMLCCDYRLAIDDASLRIGLTEARAGIPFPAGGLAILRHELPAPLLRKNALSSQIASPQQMLAHATVDGLTSRERLLDDAIAMARDLASQPAFKMIKQQLRGGLAADLQALAG